jgi:CrcB protein
MSTHRTLRLWQRLALVAVGGALGAALRFVVTVALPDAAREPWLAAPALLAVNLSGALVAGFLRGILEQAQTRGSVGGRVVHRVVHRELHRELHREVHRDIEWAEAFFLVGLCGGYTSYSAFVAGAVEGWHASPVLSASLTIATLVFAPLAALVGMHVSGGYPARPVGPKPDVGHKP